MCDRQQMCSTMLINNPSSECNQAPPGTPTTPATHVAVTTIPTNAANIGNVYFQVNSPTTTNGRGTTGPHKCLTPPVLFSDNYLRISTSTPHHHFNQNHIAAPTTQCLLWTPSPSSSSSSTPPTTTATYPYCNTAAYHHLPTIASTNNSPIPNIMTSTYQAETTLKLSQINKNQTISWIQYELLPGSGVQPISIREQDLNHCKTFYIECANATDANQLRNYFTEKHPALHIQMEMSIEKDLKNVYVTNLPPDPKFFTQEMLREMFQVFGTILSVKLISQVSKNDKLSSASPGGIGFVRFSTREEAERAIKHMNSHKFMLFDNKLVECRFANRTRRLPILTNNNNNLPCSSSISPPCLQLDSPAAGIHGLSQQYIPVVALLPASGLQNHSIPPTAMTKCFSACCNINNNLQQQQQRVVSHPLPPSMTATQQGMGGGTGGYVLLSSPYSHSQPFPYAHAFVQ